MKIKRYTPRTDIEAFQWDGKNKDNLPDWVRDAEVVQENVLMVPHSAGRTRAQPGDWIVRDEGLLVWVYTDEAFQRRFSPLD